ncbi:PQQ-binding-like beta-propeller repeat protein [Natronoarchaeum sp. GCM10025703]|uniref:outer membrane protein assembly factor BamB family protein n=1 Tax=unclassified Natronoarchaeum TaxID=2620183 RepID=UPI003614B61E
MVDGTIYLGSTNRTLYAVNAEDGSEQWSADVERDIESAPAVVDGTAYVPTHDVRALDAADGTEQWRFETESRARAGAAVGDGSLYVGDEEGVFYAIDADDGTERWRFRTGGSIWAAPLLVDDTVYVGSNDGTVYALATADGTERWRLVPNEQFPRPITGRPAVANETVYITSQQDWLYALTPPPEPDAVATYEPAAPMPEETVTFDGTDSESPESPIDSYDWTIDGDERLTGETVTREFDEPGEYDIELLVTNEATGEDSTSFIVTVDVGEDESAGETDDEGEQDHDNSMSGETTSESAGGDQDDDGSPGPGVVGSLFGVSGAAYVLGRLSGGVSDQEERD